MLPEDKVKAFENEIAYIRNPQIKEFAIKAVQYLPNYFFDIPASSTGRYHPAYTTGVGGLLRHTRAAVRIAIELARMDWWKLEGDELDLAIVSLLIHDGWKSGEIKSQYTLTEHPLIAVKMIQKNEELKSMLPKEQFDQICENTARHMGQWRFDYKTGAEVLPVPKEKMGKFVHMADYLASRKCLTMEFDVEVLRE